MTELNDVIDTLIEGQAMMASSIYIDLVNLGLIDSERAARRLHALADLAASPLHDCPQVATALASRIRSYAQGLEKVDKGQLRLRLIKNEEN